MTPEEKFNRDVWDVLRQIKEISLYIKKEQPIPYLVMFSYIDAPGETPYPNEELAVLEKLQEWGALKITNPEEISEKAREKFIGKYDEYEIRVFFEIIQPKFDAIYRQYKNSAQKGKQKPKQQSQKLFVFNATKLEYNNALFFLRLFYRKQLYILNSFCNGYLGIRNETINYFYTVLGQFVENILARKDFKKLSKEAPELFESLIGDLEAIDESWEFLQKEAYDFLGKIEKVYITAGSPSFDIPKELQEAFENIDRAIAAHKEYHDKLWERDIERIKKQFKEVDWWQSANRKSEKKKEKTEQKISTEPTITRIEITAMPELKIKNFDAPAKKAKKDTTNDILYLNDAGDLWREPKSKYCYPMGENSDRYKIVRYLASNNGYQQTLTISSALDGKNEQSIRTEIGKIRRNITKFLRIKDEGIIEGKKESGYRINPKYKIILKKE